MTVVKGTKQDRLMVISYDPWERFWKKSLVFILLACICAAAFYWGQKEGYREQQQAITERDNLRSEVDDKKRQIETLTHRVAVLEKGGEVDRKATDNMRDTVAELRKQIEVLQEETALYKGVMSPSSTKQLLKLQEVKVRTTASADRYRYKIILSQSNSKNRRFVKGFASVNVEGLLNGTKAVYPLRDLSEQVKDLGIKFNFRYFQEVEGEMVLPAGFVPEQIQIVLRSSGSKSMRLDETVPWVIQEG